MTYIMQTEIVNDSAQLGKNQINTKLCFTLIRMSSLTMIKWI